MSAKFGAFVSNELKSVLSSDPKDLSFSSEFDLYKIKHELFAQNGQTLDGDHGLNYFPFFLAYAYNTLLADGRALAIATGSFVNIWSFETTGYIFVAFNFGVR